LQGAGAGVLKDVDLMIRLTKAVIAGYPFASNRETRLGWDDNSINIDEVAERLQDNCCMSIHARTRPNVQRSLRLVTHCPREKTIQELRCQFW
jgi:tRNA-dihydrouridine synthase